MVQSGTGRFGSAGGGNNATSSASSVIVSAFVASMPAVFARERYSRTVDRDMAPPLAMALTLSPMAADSRKTSLIRRISDLGLGIVSP